MGKIVSCDTSFIIRLYKKDDEWNENAVGYFRYFLEENYQIILSTIALGEYCVKGDVSDIQLDKIRISPHNAIHAILTGKCGAFLDKIKKAGVKVVDERIIITNDVKLFAQAQIDKSDYFISFDTRSKKVYDALKQEGLITFDFLDFHTPAGNVFGRLDFPNE